MMARLLLIRASHTMSGSVRSKAVWNPRRRLIPLVAITLGLILPSLAVAAGRHPKLDAELMRRSQRTGLEVSRVIVTLVPGATLPPELKRFARVTKRLGIINGQVLDLPNHVLRQLEARPEIFRVHHDRPTVAHDFRTSITSGARAVQQGLGFTGAGIGVAVIDSGIAGWHNDLSSRTPVMYPYGDQRIAAFVDFVNGRTAPYDDEGHGTHVAGIIAGNGHDSLGRHAGVAPDATLVALKVLDADGRGTISDAIAALDWVLTNRQQYNIRVVNLSVGAAVRESYWTDPFTVAAKRVADAGVVVVTAAGNLGKNASGEALYGGVTAPGNAPWVLTVGASSTNGSLTRHDDAMAGFSSRGPTYLDWAAKPDLVASGVGTISLSAPNSTFYATRPEALVDGFVSGRPRLLDAERHQHGRAGGRRNRGADAAGESGADAERGESDPAVHRRAARRLQRAHAGRRVPEHDGRRPAGEVLRRGAARLGVSASGGVEQEDHLGQPPSLRRRHRPLGKRVRPRYDVGSRPHRRGREHHLGHDLRRRLRQHHLG